jgi:paraquat-inducible protein B
MAQRRESLLAWINTVDLPATVAPKTVADCVRLLVKLADQQQELNDLHTATLTQKLAMYDTLLEDRKRMITLMAHLHAAQEMSTARLKLLEDLAAEQTEQYRALVEVLSDIRDIIRRESIH